RSVLGLMRQRLVTYTRNSTVDNAITVFFFRGAERRGIATPSEIVRIPLPQSGIEYSRTITPTRLIKTAIQILPVAGRDLSPASLLSHFLQSYAESSSV